MTPELYTLPVCLPAGLSACLTDCLSACLSLFLPVCLPVCLSELVDQLSVLDELLSLLPSVLLSNHERRQGAGLREEVGQVRVKLEETLAASEKEKVSV